MRVGTVDVKLLVWSIDDESLKEELETGNQFLVDSEMENGRHRVFGFAMVLLDSHTLSQKLDCFREAPIGNKFECWFWPCLKKVEDGTCLC